MKVKHRVYGNGIVKHLDSDYIIIAFEDQEKKFQFPQAFEKFLTTEDSELISKIDDATKKVDADNVMQNINQTGAPSTQAKRSASSTKQLSGYINLGSTNPLIGARAQGINICSEEEMFEIVGYMATPGRINSIEAEVPKDGRDTVFENLFPGQKYRPIEMGNTPSGLLNKLSPQFRINFGNLRNCPSVLKQNMGKGNGACIGRINKSRFVIQIVQEYGFCFGEHQNVETIRGIAKKCGFLDAFERGYSM